MRPRTSIAVILSLTLAHAASGQGSAIIPSGNTSQEGNSLDGVFAYDRSRMLQYIDSSLLTAIPNAALLKAVSYRRDTQVTAPVMSRTSGGPKYKPIWYTRLHDYQGSVFAPSPTWPPRPDQGQPAPGWTTVIRAQQIDFPDLPLPGSGLPGFDLRLPFDQPLQYSFAGPGLGIDHFTYRPDNQVYYSNYYVDAVQQTSTGGTVQLIAPTTVGCPPGQNRATGIAPDPGGTLVFTLYGPSSTFAWAQLASAATATDLTPIGLPGCSWYLLPPTVTSFTLTNAAGIADLRTPVPLLPALAGASLLGQWIVSDPRVNPQFAFGTSDGLRMTIGTDLSASQVLMSTLTNSNPIDPYGVVSIGRGVVLQLDW